MLSKSIEIRTDHATLTCSWARNCLLTNQHKFLKCQCFQCQLPQSKSKAKEICTYPLLPLSLMISLSTSLSNQKYPPQTPNSTSTQIPETLSLFCYHKSLAFNLEQCPPLRGSWQIPETLLWRLRGEILSVLLASSGSRPEMLLNFPQGTGKYPQTKDSQPKMSTVLRWRNAGIDELSKLPSKASPQRTN